MKPYYTIDKTAFPIIRIKFNPVEPSEEEFEQYLKDMEEFVLAETPYLRIFNASEAKYLSAKFRIRQAEWIKKHKEAIKTYSMGSVFVIPSLIVKVVFQMITIVSPLPDAHTVVSSMEDAEEWAKKQIAKYY